MVEFACHKSVYLTAQRRRDGADQTLSGRGDSPNLQKPGDFALEARLERGLQPSHQASARAVAVDEAQLSIDRSEPARG